MKISNLNQENLKWEGTYSLELMNRDEIIISYSIDLKEDGGAFITYREDGEKSKFEGVYYMESQYKIKVLYDDETLYIEKSEDGNYFISGEPIYFINPGNEEYEIKKIDF